MFKRVRWKGTPKVDQHILRPYQNMSKFINPDLHSVKMGRAWAWRFKIRQTNLAQCAMVRLVSVTA